MGKVDFLIVGQGIAGSILAHELLREKQEVVVIDEETDFTSSNRAAGLYNPITGRKMVKTWLADKLFPGLEDYYHEMENVYGGKFLYPKTIYRPFYSVEELNDWQAKAGIDEYRMYIKEIISSSLKIAGVNDNHGGLMLNYSGYVDVPELITCLRQYLIKNNRFTSDVFDYEELEVKGSRIHYRDWEADHIIFCEGPQVRENPFWKNLPFRPVKGEIIDIKAPLPTDLIINRGVFMLPKNGVFRIGSTYDHDQLDFIPTEKGIKMLINRLSKTYSGPYEIVDHTAGVRPATYDRRPFIGKHPHYQEVGIFNGFGTKGVSLVPYFGRQFVNCFLHGGSIDQEVSVDRVKI